MIRVPRPGEPENFHETVRRRGQKWLEQHAEGRPPSYWREALPELRAAFAIRCAYTAMLDRCGTVDHFVAAEHDRTLLYEWDNLRHASGWINSSKQDVTGILDPYEVGEGWFEVLLPSLQLVATDRVPPDKRALVEATLRRLPIVDDERVVRQRREWLHEYEQGRVDLEGLRRYAPLVAAAVEKRDVATKPTRARSTRAKTKPARAKRSRG